MTRFHHLLTHSANGVKTITLNRPEKRNALCPLLIEELTLALDEAETCGCGVVILTGAGSAFCAGLDLEHLAAIHARTAGSTAETLKTWPGCCALFMIFPSR
jgi:methylglutaconyl-CoA hydratase